MIDLVRSPNFWFAILAGICVIGPYVLRVQPRTRRQWLCVAVTLALLTWLLPHMAALRSR